MSMKYMNKSIKELHELLVAKKVTAKQLTEEAIELAKSNTNNLLEATNYEQALKEAEAITEVKEEEFFKGIPYIAKDNISTKGLETTASSKILEGYVPTFDAEVITRLKNAGAILIAKSTLDELAMGGTGTSGHKGVTTNPYNPEHLIGGSSCGSAAAVAAGIVPFALGSDTGDSVRKPASFAGLVGIKPSWGRISRLGLFPFATSMDAIGYFTRNVYDSAKVLELLAGYDEKDMSSSKKEVENYSHFEKDTSSKIGYFKAIIDNLPDEDVKNSFFKVLEELKKQGHEIIAYDFPQDLLNAIYPTYMVLSCAEATSNNANLDGIRFGPNVENAKDYEDYIMKARTAGFSDMIKRRFIIGSFSLLAENQDELFRNAQRARRLIVNELNKFFEVADHLVLPASPSVAPLISSVTTTWSKKPDFVDNHMALANFSGSPSITLPLGFKNDLPFGINITTRPFEEKKLFDIALNIEEITKLKDLVANKEEK